MRTFKCNFHDFERTRNSDIGYVLQRYVGGNVNKPRHAMVTAPLSFGQRLIEDSVAKVASGIVRDRGVVASLIEMRRD